MSGEENAMRLVRLGTEPTKVGGDVRVALTAWGPGTEVRGGVALVGWTPPGNQQPWDAVIVLPRGLIVVTGVDLPEPALSLEAPLHMPWKVDGWPLVRTEGAVNPALDALEAATTLAGILQGKGITAPPITTVVAVGPYAGQVIQPAMDLNRGVRVLYPTTTSMLSATRELATYQRPYPVTPVRRLLEALTDGEAAFSDEELATEGFPAESEVDPALVDTVALTIDSSRMAAAPAIRFPATTPSSTPLRTGVRKLTQSFSAASRRVQLITVSATAVVVCVIAALATMAGTSVTAAPRVEHVTIDGVNFIQELSQRNTNCAQHSYGDVQAWFGKQPCVSLARQDFSTEVNEHPAAVGVAMVSLPNTASAAGLRELLYTAGSGGITDLVAEGDSWNGSPSSFDGSAETVEQDGSQVKIVLAVWARGVSQPTDVELRALAERGLRLPVSP
jgi:hypothetical protein